MNLEPDVRFDDKSAKAPGLEAQDFKKTILNILRGSPAYIVTVLACTDEFPSLWPPIGLGGMREA